MFGGGWCRANATPGAACAPHASFVYLRTRVLLSKPMPWVRLPWG